ncbi:MAG: PRD domain-containing protein [Atopobiaceae bacterium]|jgi:beta-glucoside operon transcriptional antiterminator|nr:PRD domain-containing protein [Atopobiaceae bacterium]
MWITMKINNNCAMARDSSGQDIVVFGKGIGFRRPPYELTDLSSISHTFYGVKRSSLAVLTDVSDDLVLLASDICDMARDSLDVELNPNAPFTLADHINFALKRIRDGIVIETPLAYDVRHLYPREVAIAKRAVAAVERRMGVELPDAEVTNFALHLIDAEAEQGDLSTTVMVTQVVADVTKIVEEGLGIKVDTESFSYARFAMHLRYLVTRILNGTPSDARMAEMLGVIKGEYPDSWAVVGRIVSYLSERWQWSCDESECLYLLIHVQKLKDGVASDVR